MFYYYLFLIHYICFILFYYVCSCCTRFRFFTYLFYLYFFLILISVVISCLWNLFCFIFFISFFQMFWYDLLYFVLFYFVRSRCLSLAFPCLFLYSTLAVTFRDFLPQQIRCPVLTVSWQRLWRLSCEYSLLLFPLY